MKTADKIKFVTGLVLLFGGLDLTILLSHTNRLYGVLLILIGLGMIYWASLESREERIKAEEKPENIASRFVEMLTFGGRFRLLLPAAGLMVLVSLLAFNLMIADEFYLGSNDYVALVLAGVLLAYNFIPEKYFVERDFALLFSIFLFVFLVIPTTMLEMTNEGAGVDTNSPLTYYFLAMPTAGLANLFGMGVVSPFMDAGTPIYNIMQVPGPDGFPLNLSISLSCSGLYSVAIFISAFIAFVAVEYRRFDRRVLGLLGVGILLAWFANVLRMFIIILVGHYKGLDAMLWTHNNIGELIFMAWVILFWIFMFRYFDVLDRRDPAAGRRRERGPKGRCPICRESLSPVIPSTKCECGAILHSGCVLTNDRRCPSCGVEIETLNDPK